MALSSLRLPQFLIFILLDLNRSDTLFLILTCFDLWVSGRWGFIFNTSPVDAFILYTLDLEGLHIMFISLHSYAWLLPYSLYQPIGSWQTGDGLDGLINVVKRAIKNEKTRLDCEKNILSEVLGQGISFHSLFSIFVYTISYFSQLGVFIVFPNLIFTYWFGSFLSRDAAGYLHSFSFHFLHCRYLHIYR